MHVYGLQWAIVGHVVAIYQRCVCNT